MGVEMKEEMRMQQERMEVKMQANSE
jgi:hypothetical protein